MPLRCSDVLVYHDQSEVPTDPGRRVGIKLGMPLAAICILFICLVSGVVVVRVANELMRASQILENSIVGNF